MTHADKSAEREHLKGCARAALPKGATLYVITRKRSRSGGTVSVTPMSILPDGRPAFMSHLVSALLGCPRGQYEGHDVVRLGGFTPQGWLAERLGEVLYGDPAAITERSI